MSDRPGARLTGRLTLLVASMRAGGARVGARKLLSAHRALAAIEPSDRETAYFALRTSLCSTRDDVPPFDAAFAEWFSAQPRVSAPAGEAFRARPAEGVELVPAAWSDAELLREKDFAAYTDAERVAAGAVIRRLAGAGPARPSRRAPPARRRGAPHDAGPDLRRTMRSSLRTAGNPFERHWRERAERPRPLALVCDGSSSMAPYARMLLQYMQARTAAGRRAEAFVLGTGAACVTAELPGRDPARALGEALAELNRKHGRRLGRGALVVVLSDGWDRGDPEQLSGEMARLARGAHALIWLNPLRAHPAYEPLTLGMQAALPYVDHFLAGNSLASLEELALLMDGGLG